MIELILAGIIIALLLGFGWYVREQEREKSKLINAILAKNPQEFNDLNLTDKLKPQKPQVEKPPDLVSTEDMTDEEFDKQIAKEIA